MQQILKPISKSYVQQSPKRVRHKVPASVAAPDKNIRKRQQLAIATHALPTYATSLNNTGKNSKTSKSGKKGKKKQSTFRNQALVKAGKASAGTRVAAYHKNVQSKLDPLENIIMEDDCNAMV